MAFIQTSAIIAMCAVHNQSKPPAPEQVIIIKSLVFLMYNVRSNKPHEQLSIILNIADLALMKVFRQPALRFYAVSAHGSLSLQPQS